MDLSDFLPFRTLSPGTCKPKMKPRNRDTKLSLRSRMPVPAMKNGKENKPPSTIGRWRKSDSNSTDSDLITSDESNLSGFEDEVHAKRDSVLTFNSQESTLSLPIAESTRCEGPMQETKGLVKSTNSTLCSANSGSSSESTEYLTACPLPVGCDDSIVYISDSSPEPAKKLSSKALSVLLTSDESDTELQTSNYLHQNVLSRARKGEPNRLCDTVILETSHSDDSDESVIDKRSECGIVIPPSIRSDNESCSDHSATSSISSDMHVNVDFPPTLCSKNCEADPKNTPEIGDLGKDVTKNSKANQDNKLVPSCSMNSHGNTRTEHESHDSSWKTDFHLVLQESSVNCEESANSNKILKTCISPKKLRSISKEKYNDIARWLFSGNDSLERSSKSPHSAEDLYSKENPDVEAAAVTADVIPRARQHPQVKRLSIVKRSSFGSESDDNFDALIKSIRKKKNHNVEKGNSKFTKDDSFINDTSDDESPSPNVYYSDLTKSIRKEVESVQKSVKNMKKRYILSHLNDSSDESGKEQPGSPVLKPAGASNSNLKSVRIRKVIYSDDSDSEPLTQQKKGEIILSDDSDFDCKSSRNHKVPTWNDPAYGTERLKLPPSQTSSTTKGKKNDNKSKSLGAHKSSESSSSDIKAPTHAKMPLWRTRENLCGSVSSSSTSSDTPDKELKGADKKEIPTKLFKKPIGISERLPVLTPKKVTVLKSPRTPYSPIRTFLSSLSGPSHEPGVRDHPEAAVYNKNFKAKKEELTRRLFKLFNREVFDLKLPGDMLLEWNPRLARTAGLCYCKLVRKAGVTSRTAKIALSTKVITSPDRLRDTLIHEMCHAAVWLLNNVSGGHGQFWKVWAHRAMKRFPELPPIERCHSYKIETKYLYKCTKCGYSFGRHSKSLDLEKKRCGYCYGEFELFLSGKDQGPSKILKTPKAPSAFALFVKENYGLIKQENGALRHGDVMKKLGENFAAMKVKNSEG